MTPLNIATAQSQGINIATERTAQNIPDNVTGSFKLYRHIMEFGGYTLQYLPLLKTACKSATKNTSGNHGGPISEREAKKVSTAELLVNKSTVEFDTEHKTLPIALQREIESGYEKYLERSSYHHYFIVRKACELHKKWDCIDLYSLINILGALYDADDKVDFDSLSPENIWLHRGTSVEFIDQKKREIGNIPTARAQILDNKSNDIEFKYKKFRLTHDYIDLRYSNSNSPNYSADLENTSSRTCLPHGGINVLVSTKETIDNPYTDSINIRINLADALAKNATIYTDTSAVFAKGAVVLALPMGTTVQHDIVSSTKPMPSNGLLDSCILQ